MRIAIFLYCAFALCATAAEPSNLQTQRATLRSQANQILETEKARQKAGDCPAAKTTYDANICFGQEVSITDKNLKAYQQTLRDLLALHDPSVPDNPSTFIAGAQLSHQQRVAEFDRTEQIWESYLDTASTAAFHQFGGGTGGPSFQMQTHLRLARSHMQDLNSIYDTLLHL